MKWMLIVSGLLAARAFAALLRVWAGKGKSNKGEVSLMATVKRILTMARVKHPRPGNGS